MSTLWKLIPVLLSSVFLAQAQDDLDATVRRTLEEFHVPGIAVGVIEDGHVVVAKGYGVRKQGASAPVSEHTLFQIASNTKAFTSAALATLVDEKKLSWDERVIDVLPNFQMSDPFVSREMQVRDLLCHRSGLGLGAGDLMFFPNATLSVPAFMQHLRYVPLATSFRSRYAYDNVLYTVAGQVIEKVSGKSWAEYIQEKIFVPLGMSESHTSVTEAGEGAELAAAHVRTEGVLETVPETNLGAAAPAGAIVSSVQDLLKWVNTQLHEGEYAGGRLFSAAQSREMWTPEIFIPIPVTYPKELAAARPQFQAYALGWVVYDYHGQRIVYHTGGLAGMVTRVTLVPEKKLGLVVLTNQEDGGAFQAVTLSILDHYLRLPKTDWVAAYSSVERRQQQEAREKVSSAAAKRDAHSKPSLPLEKYAGRYRDPWYGDVTITHTAGGLRMEFSHSPSLTGKLEHFQYDTFIVHWDKRSLDADAYVSFALAPNGSIREVKMEPVSTSTDFSFDFQDLALKPAGEAAPW